MSYRRLDVWQLARGLVTDIHQMSLSTLPKYEFYEVGSQIRRSMKSVKSNIVEGYGRRRYKGDYLRFLTCSHASCDETIDHLETLFETKSHTDPDVYMNLHVRLNKLGGKLNHLIRRVESSHRT